MTYKFTLVRKLQKENSSGKGLSLRSIKGDSSSCLMVLLCGSYSIIKTAVENFRMQKGCNINFRTRGKALEITSTASAPMDALETLLNFLPLLPFSHEDTAETAEFCSRYLPFAEHGCKLISINMDQNQLTLEMSAELDLSENASEDEFCYASEALCEKLMPALDKYSIGIIK